MGTGHCPNSCSKRGAADKSAGAAGSVSADEFSTTNLQVEGVDEADIIKNDGKYVYMIKAAL